MNASLVGGLARTTCRAAARVWSTIFLIMNGAFFNERYSQCLPPTGDLLPGRTEPPASSPTPPPNPGCTEPPASVSTPEPVDSNPTTTPTSEPTFEPTTDCLPRGSKCRSNLIAATTNASSRKRMAKRKRMVSVVKNRTFYKNLF
jgi:hypothetical protein